MRNYALTWFTLIASIVVQSTETRALVQNHLVDGPAQFSVSVNAASIAPVKSLGRFETGIVELDWIIGGLDISDDGKYAVVWGKNPASSGSRPPRYDHELAVLDLETLTTVIQKTFETEIRAATIDDQFVFVAPDSPSLIYRFDRETLKEEKRRFFNSSEFGHDARIASFHKLSNKKLGVQVSLKSKMIAMLDRQTLKLEKQPGSNYTNDRPICVRLPNGQTRLKQMVVDSVTGNPVCLISVLFDPAIEMRNQTGINSHRIYGRENYASQQALTQPSRESPIVYYLSKDGGTNGRTLLETRAISDGKLLDSRKIQSKSRAFTKNSFKVTANRLVYAEGKNVLVAQTPEIDNADIPHPLYFVWPDVKPLNSKEIKKIQLTTVGGKGKIKYSLKKEFPAISIDADSGEIKIDTPKIWQEYVQSFNRGIRNRSMRYSPDIAKKRYEKLFGTSLPPDAIPVTIPIVVGVFDEDSQTDSITFFPVILGSKTELDKVINDRRAAQQAGLKKRIEEERQKLLAAQLAEKKWQESGGKVPGKTRGIGQLDRDLRRMDITLDAILLRLQEMKQERSK